MAKEPKPKPEKKSKQKPAKGEKPDSAKQAMGEGGEGMEGEGMAPAKKKLAGKTLILFIVLPALIILGGGGATAFFLLSKPKAEQHASAEHAKDGADHKDKKGKGHKVDKKAKDGHAKPGKEGEGASAEIVEGADGVLYYKMPDLLVNITTGDGRPVYLKLKLTVETHSEEAIAAIEPNLPRVLDQYQGFLRELRVDDIAGSAGAYRLRLELLRRVNLAIAPAQADQVLIEEMLVQ